VRFDCCLPAKNNVVWQFIPISPLVIGEMLVQRGANLHHYPGDTNGIVSLVEMAEDFPDLFIPEGGANFVVYPFIAKEGELPVFEGDINEHAVTGSCLLHVQGGENLSSPVDGIHIAAATLDIYTDLAAGELLSLTDGRNDLLSFSFGKSHLFRKVWNMQKD